MIKMLIAIYLLFGLLVLATSYCCSIGVVMRLSRLAGQRVCIASVR